MPRRIDRKTSPLIPLHHKHLTLNKRLRHTEPRPPVMHRRRSFHHTAPEPRALKRRHSHNRTRPQPRPLMQNQFFKWPVKKRSREYDNETIGHARAPAIRGRKIDRLSNEQLKRRELTFHNGRVFDSKGNRFDTRDSTEKMIGRPRVKTDKANFIMTGNGKIRVDKHPTVGKRHHTSLARK